MSRHFSLAVVAMLSMGLLCGFPALSQVQAQGKKAAASGEPKIMAFNPLGIAPPIKLKPMAPRHSILAVNVGVGH